MKEINLIPLEKINFETLSQGDLIGSDSNNLSCYFGYRPKNMETNIFCYNLCVGFRENDNDSCSYIKLENGALLWTYKPESKLTQYYHAPDFHLLLPSGAQGYFAIISKDRTINKIQTEKTFGFVKEDLEKIVKVYCQIMGIDGYKVGRVTFSKTRHNYCDLTGVSIPNNFPYIAFDDSNYIWSHVSLYGFYCHLSFLLNKREYGALYNLMLDQGIENEWLDRIIKIPITTRGKRVIVY